MVHQLSTYGSVQRQRKARAMSELRPSDGGGEEIGVERQVAIGVGLLLRVWWTRKLSAALQLKNHKEGVCCSGGGSVAAHTFCWLSPMRKGL